MRITAYNADGKRFWCAASGAEPGLVMTSKPSRAVEFVDMRDAIAAMTGLQGTHKQLSGWEIEEDFI